MQSSLKKSLYLGLAALSFGAVATVSTTASAKSYATAGAYTTLKTDATTRNVEATGTNALYTKPGTVKGAKVVASKATMAKLAASKKSADYFRAYGVKTTNRGSVYYRVVTMDGKYRGYVYGGKSDTAFAGGIKSAETTTAATTPAKTTGFYLKDTTKNTLWTAPKYTQYKASKVSLYGVKSSDTFTVDKAATKTREGSLYYHVTDTQNSAISGWIYAGKGYVAGATTQELGGLSLTKSAAAATENNSVTVNYIGANKNTIKSTTYVTTQDNTKKGQTIGNANDGTAFAAFVNDKTNIPAGYKLASTVVADGPVVKDTQFGGTFNITVTKEATSKISFYAITGTGNAITGSTKMSATDFAGKTFPVVSATNQEKLTGNDGATIADPYTLASEVLNGVDLVSSDKVVTDVNGIKGVDANGNEVTIKQGEVYHVTYAIDPTSTKGANTKLTYGDTIKVGLTVDKTVAGSATASNSNSANGNYAE